MQGSGRMSKEGAGESYKTKRGGRSGGEMCGKYNRTPRRHKTPDGRRKKHRKLEETDWSKQHDKDTAKLARLSIWLLMAAIAFVITTVTTITLLGAW